MIGFFNTLNDFLTDKIADEIILTGVFKDVATSLNDNKYDFNKCLLDNILILLDSDYFNNTIITLRQLDPFIDEYINEELKIDFLSTYRQFYNIEALL